MNPNHYVSVAGLVVKGENILLIKNPSRGWEFPGGMVEAGETLQQALKREIWEESGVTVAITGFIGICKNIVSNIVNIDFACNYIGGSLTTSDESCEVRWFSREEALVQVENKLTKKRLENMLSSGSEISCFSFTKDPFTILEEQTFKA